VGLVEAGQYALGFTGGILALHDLWSPALLVVPIGLLYRSAKTRKELHDSTRILLEQMADSVDRRDPWTHEHSIRVMKWTRTILAQHNVTGPEQHLILTAARVHDIGKMALPDEVLQKHDCLSEEEWRLIKTHPGIGASMLEHYPAFARGAEIVRSHHERWDGRGYPDGSSGTAIPFGGRVIAVADSFDAMTSDRPYRVGMSVERAAGVLRAGAGTQWDPHIVEAFLRSIVPAQEEPACAGSAIGGMLVTSTV
jgi:HD-GYP domain-containing protein (c-di-GMP phosphodiesterase class II)